MRGLDVDRLEVAGETLPRSWPGDAVEQHEPSGADESAVSVGDRAEHAITEPGHPRAELPRRGVQLGGGRSHRRAVDPRPLLAQSSELEQAVEGRQPHDRGHHRGGLVGPEVKRRVLVGDIGRPVERLGDGSARPWAVFVDAGAAI